MNAGAIELRPRVVPSALKDPTRSPLIPPYEPRFTCGIAGRFGAGQRRRALRRQQAEHYRKTGKSVHVRPTHAEQKRAQRRVRAPTV